MSILEVAKKVGELCKGRTIHFDFKSYDDENDIPRISDGASWYKVESVRFNEDGDFFEILADKFACGVKLNDMTDKEFEDETNKMGLYELLSNVYYETEESMELGDFESDFLGIPWWDLSK